MICLAAFSAKKQKECKDRCVFALFTLALLAVTARFIMQIIRIIVQDNNSSKIITNH